MKRILFILLPVLVLAGNYVLKKDVLSYVGKKITSTHYILRGTIKSGVAFRTVYGSQGPQSGSSAHVPISYAFNIFPNPFAKKTSIKYALPHPGLVKIKVYDVSGKLVKTLVSERLNPGFYKADWYGDDDIGRNVAAGVYFIRMNTKEFKSQQKVIFVR